MIEQPRTPSLSRSASTRLDRRPGGRSRQRSRTAVALAAVAACALVAACSGGGGGRGEDGEVVARPVVGDVLKYTWTGTKKILFIVVEYDDKPALFETSAAGEQELRDVANFTIDAFDRDSNGRTKLEIDYTWPPVRVSRTTTSYPANEILVHVRADAIAAAKAAGYDPDAYEREVVFADGSQWPSFARGWIRTAWMPHTIPRVVVHEIGHTLSRGHADFWNGDPLGGGNCEDYGDLFDPMGGGGGQSWNVNEPLHSGPWTKLRAGWLDPSDIETVTRTGTFTLAPLEFPDAAVGPSALRIRLDERYDYWVAHRATEPVTGMGVVIMRTPSNPYLSSHLLDMRRGIEIEREAVDAALMPGAVFDDAARGIVIENVTRPDDPHVSLQVTVDETRQTTLDVLPQIEVIQPPRDQGPLSGTFDVEVRATDPDVGTTDGEGIEKVTLRFFFTGSDPTASALASTELTEPPYVWQVDTVAVGALDYFHYLEVTAESTNGATNTIGYRVVVDNYTPTLERVAPSTGASADATNLGERVVLVPVVDASGAPVVGAELVTLDGDTARTDDAGVARFRLRDRPETFWFRGTARAPGFSERPFLATAHAAGRPGALGAPGLDPAAELTVSVPNPMHAATTSALVLDRAAVARGIVTNDAGEALAGARIVVHRPLLAAKACESFDVAETTWTATTDELGGYWLEGLPVGVPLAWSIETAGGSATEQRTLEAGDGSANVIASDWRVAPR